jgi:predicted dehydrogenase
MAPIDVALIGATGHGLHHRRQLALRDDVRLVAMADIGPVAHFEDAPLGDTPVYRSHRDLLGNHHTDVVIVVTPPATHLPIALDVLAAGRDLLLEKPPVRTVQEHDTLAAASARSGRAVQIGFQALGSKALEALRRADLGTITSVAIAGAWWRPDTYWTRSPWSGKRGLDGALVNPFAHALMQALAIAGLSGEATVELERFRTRAIETDDTSSLRITGAGPVVTAAVSLCSTEFIRGEITVTGTGGTAILEYPTDRLKLPGDDDLREIPGRVSLLDNLVAHRRHGEPLLVPLDRTRPFTVLAELINTAPPPLPIGAGHLVPHPDGTGLAVDGIAPVTRAAAAAGALYSELPVPWAAAAEPFIEKRGF